MTIGSEAVIEAVWPQDIPRDYDEMQKMYGGFVANTLRKYNKVDRNFRDLHAYIWLRLIAVDVIGKFMASVQNKLPKTMTAVEACEFLGVSFNQWRTKMWAYHMGDPVYSVIDGKQRMICRRAGGWMPTPLNIAVFQAKGQKGYSAKTAIFDSEDIVRLASDERQMKNGSIRGPFAKQGPINPPQLKATKGHFQSYVACAIQSNFANWCRTDKRRFSQDRPMRLSTDSDRDETQWEARLPDPTGTNQEVRAQIQEALDLISTTFHRSMDGIPTCKPIEEHETEMFDMLEQGYTLAEALKEMKVPERVRRDVLRSVADLRSTAAA